MSLREDRRLQAVGRVIGHAHRLVDRGEAHQRHHRSEDLLLEERHIHCHFSEHGRLHETAPALTASQQFCPGCHRPVHKGFHLDGRLLVDQRAHVGVFKQLVADLECQRLFGQQVGELVVNGRFHQDTFHRAADLPVATRQPPQHHCRGGLLQVGIRQDDQGVVTAQFHVHLLEVLRGHFGDPHAHLGAAGDGDELDAGRACQEIADQRAGSGDHLMGAARQTALLHQFGDLQQCQRAGAGRFRDDRVAGGQRCGGLVPPQFHRVVERNDRSHHPQRLADGEGEVALITAHCIHRHHPTEDALAFLGKATENIGSHQHLGACLQDGLAILRCQQPAQFLAVRFDRQRDAVQDLVALERREPAHGFLALLGDSHHAGHILQRAARYPVEHLARTGVADLDPCPV